MIPNYVMQNDLAQMQNLIGMQRGPAYIYSMGPGYAPSVSGWTLQNLNEDLYCPPEFEDQLPSLGLMNLISGTANGNKLATKAMFIANSRKTNGNSFKAVADAVNSVIGGYSASTPEMALDQLRQSGKYTEYTQQTGVKSRELPNLPPGAIVVWRKTCKALKGDISIALGNGLEASDHIANQRIHLNGDAYQHRVFMPKLI